MRYTVKDDRDVTTGQGFQLNDGLEHDPDCVLVDVENMTFGP